MDIGVHILGSVTTNENGLPGQKEFVVGSKNDRSIFDGEDSLQRSSKLAKTTGEEEEEDLSSSSAYSKTVPFHQGIPIVRSSFISSDSRNQELMLSFSDKPEALDSSNKNSLSPLLHQILPPSYFRSSGGYGCGGMVMNMSMQGKGPFTLTQWAELEQQALIYKYITANVPVPSSLLVSIKKSFYPYGSLPPSSFGWGTFHLGFAGGNMDPEPGRCRRTDGKKWRCSRDAVLDQKYCERHINRGRHRSRKHVEVQSNQTAVTQPQQSLLVSGTNRKPSNLTGSQYINPSTDSVPNNSVSVYPSIVKESPVVQQKQRNNNNPFEFGHISSDSLLNPSSTKTYRSSFLDFSSNQDKHSENNNIHNTWPEEMKSDWTQLSMSIPITSSSSPSSTHNNNSVQDKIVLSPLRLSREFEPSVETLEPVKKVNTWIPISWGNSLGGPLGEVLNSSTNSPTLRPSPTFCSLSNSSSVSSPIVENNGNNGDYFLHSTCN